MFASLKIAARLMIETINFRLHEIVRRYVRKIAEMVLMDLDLTAVLSEVGAAAAFERKHLMDAAHFKGRHQLYAYALTKLPEKPEGLLLEFGVYKGDSINRLARLMPAGHWYGFDSFKGLPEAWTPAARRGAFNMRGRLPPV
jgi:hypothetical protein